MVQLSLVCRALSTRVHTQSTKDYAQSHANYTHWFPGLVLLKRGSGEDRWHN